MSQRNSIIGLIAGRPLSTRNFARRGIGHSSPPVTALKIEIEKHHRTLRCALERVITRTRPYRDDLPPRRLLFDALTRPHGSIKKREATRIQSTRRFSQWCRAARAFLGSRSDAVGKVVLHHLSSVKYLSHIRQLLSTAFQDLVQEPPTDDRPSRREVRSSLIPSTREAPLQDPMKR